MKKNCFKLFAFTLIIGGILCAFSCSTTKKINAPKVPGIEITFTGEEVADTVFVSVAPIPTDTSLYFLDYFNATDQGVRRAYPVKDRKVFILPEEVPSVYKIHCDYYSFPSVEMRKTEHVDMQVSRLSPSRYTIEHSAFPNPIPYSDEFYQLKRKLWKLSRYKLTDQEFDSLSVEMRLLIDV